jgi:plastocyanin
MAVRAHFIGVMAILLGAASGALADRQASPPAPANEGAAGQATSVAGPASAAPVASRPGLVAPPSPPGVIRGTVTFAGKAPPRERLQRDTDPVCAAVEKSAEDVVVTAGKLAGVLVRLKNGSAGTFAPPAEPAVIVQRECMYEPRVLGVMVGQTLVIRNADPTYHNIRGVHGDAPLFNLSQPAATPDLERSGLGAAGDVVELHCDVHPWMHAFVVLQDHPFFAVTGPDGSFALTGVPAGKYTLEAWHPVLGMRTASVVVGKGARAKVTAKLRYAAGKPAVPAR